MLISKLCGQELVLLLPDLGQLFPCFFQLPFLPEHFFLGSNDLRTEVRGLAHQVAGGHGEARPSGWGPEGQSVLT